MIFLQIISNLNLALFDGEMKPCCDVFINICTKIYVGLIIHVVAFGARYLGVQQCFGVVYHELTTLRQVYFARAA